MKISQKDISKAIRLFEYFQATSSDSKLPNSNQLEDKRSGPLRQIWDEVILLYNYAKDPETSKKNKTMIVAALIYLVTPIDAIPDAVPLLGLVDDLGIISYVLKTLANELSDYKTKGKIIIK